MALVIDKAAILTGYPECYACDERATGFEHAPGRVFFPEGADFRKNLIRVPSCDAHNAEKSKDDLYAAWHVTDAVVSQNRCADLVKAKLDRMVKRDWNEREGRFARRLVGEIQSFDGTFFVGELDGPRMINFMRRCAQAVYFYDTLEKLRYPLNVANLGKDFRDPERSAKLRDIERSFDAERWRDASGEERIGKPSSMQLWIIARNHE